MTIIESTEIITESTRTVRAYGSSAGEAISSIISKAAATLFSVTITESLGIVRTDKSRYQLGKKFWL